MANTVIQLKYSTITDTPSLLNIAEPAYSYSSNTLFIGSPASTGSIAIGGKFYLDQQANIFNLVNTAFTTANVNTGVDVTQNTSITAAFSQANTATNNALSASNYANGAFTNSNTAVSNALSASNYANGAFTKANTVSDTATASFIRANNSISANAGGTITGDLIVTGNLTISGQTTYANTTNVQLGDNIITLNADLSTVAGASGVPSENAGIEVNRGNTLANSSLLWVESAGKWQANTGAATGAYFLANEAAATSAGIYANGAFTNSNTAVSNALSASNYANGAFAQANVTVGVDATQNNSITAAFLQANTATNNALSASNYANGAFSLANGTAVIANTDVTNISISSADYGSATAVASFKVAANGRIISANTTAIAIAASQITSGTLGVARGGTGATSFPTSGVLLGQGTSAITTASSSTEGHVLTINTLGVPVFTHIQGGTF